MKYYWYQFNECVNFNPLQSRDNITFNILTVGLNQSKNKIYCDDQRQILINNLLCDGKDNLHLCSNRPHKFTHYISNNTKIMVQKYYKYGSKVLGIILVFFGDILCEFVLSMGTQMQFIFSVAQQIIDQYLTLIIAVYFIFWLVEPYSEYICI